MRVKLVGSTWNSGRLTPRKKNALPPALYPVKNYEPVFAAHPSGYVIKRLYSEGILLKINKSQP